MRLKLTLQGAKGQMIPINYQYPMSACIYKIIERADSAYSLFLHETGHRAEGRLKSFKLFTFSNLSMPCRRIDDRLQLLTDRAEMQIAFHVPSSAEKFIIGIFKDQQIEISDRNSRARFSVMGVEVREQPLLAGSIVCTKLRPLSPTVVGYKNERGHYTFLAPDHPEFIYWLSKNLQEKMETAGVKADLFKIIKLGVHCPTSGSKSRLLTIKAGTREETKIKGFTHFEINVEASAEVVDLMLNAGVGLYNALGCGFVEKQ